MGIKRTERGENRAPAREQAGLVTVDANPVLVYSDRAFSTAYNLPILTAVSSPWIKETGVLENNHNISFLYFLENRKLFRAHFELCEMNFGYV